MWLCPSEGQLQPAGRGPVRSYMIWTDVLSEAEGRLVEAEAARAEDPLKHDGLLWNVSVTEATGTHSCTRIPNTTLSPHWCFCPIWFFLSSSRPHLQC